MIMRKEIFLLILLSVTPSLAALVFPALSFIGPVLLLVGFAFLIIIGHRSAKRQSKYGALSQWFEPSKFVGMKTDTGEGRLLRVASCITLGGLLVIAVSVFMQ
jgi:hypothetical protein